MDENIKVKKKRGKREHNFRCKLFIRKIKVNIGRF